ncbi:hypothetical protein [Abyssalbus ytuae]|uniref:Uncharacterized protein n=1 Tax=Abyssalbus ytuae TaxID=2926907 RepID=A0A9E7CU29_9FLAO|nr:hypothetical protein [Abyssalbus ytuae]UOB17472.1 hypothetical protein MQE35_17265 [Abyssalbus ytuae]
MHVLTHDDEDNNKSCELCDFTLLNDHTPVIGNEVSSPISEAPLFLTSEVKLLYYFISAGEISTESLFSRPPPVLA